MLKKCLDIGFSYGVLGATIIVLAEVAYVLLVVDLAGGPL